MGSVRVDPAKHSRAQTLDLAQAPLQVPSPLSPPLVQHGEEPVARDGVDVDLAALGSAAAGLVFNECSGWGGWRGTGSLGVGELLVCERPVDGFSLSPPGQALQADTMRKLVVLEDVVLKSAFPELLPTGASDGPPPLDWWPTQTNRQGEGGALGPHVVERGGIQIEGRRGALADEAVHGKHFTGEKTLVESEKAEKNKIFIIQTVTPLFFLETNLSITFQGDFCVPLQKRGVKRRAARAAHKETKRRAAAHEMDRVLRVPVTTPTQSPTSSFSNLMMSLMTLRCSSHVQAQGLLPLRLHVTRLMIGSDMSGKCVLKKISDCGNKTGAIRK